MSLPVTVTVTRAKHPLEGQALRLLGKMRRHGHEELLCVLDDGTKSLVPASWTNYPGAEAAVAPSTTLGTLADLLVASTLARKGFPGPQPTEVQAAGKPPSKEDDHAACTAESADRNGPRASTADPGRAPRARRRRGDASLGDAHSEGLGDRRHDDGGGRR